MRLTALFFDPPRRAPHLNALAFNVSDAGHGRYIGCRYGEQGRGHGRMQGRGCSPPAYSNGFPQGEGNVIPSILGNGGGPPGGFHGGPAGVPPPYHASPAVNRGYYPTGGYSIPPGPSGVPPAQANVRQLYSNVEKHFSNRNAHYSCSFDIADGHTSMSCPPHLPKSMHHIGFNRQNAQQYIDLGHSCSMKNRHKTLFPTNM